MVPRCVVVERPTEYRELLARHATREQARFFLEQRGMAIEAVEARDQVFTAARTQVLAAIPHDWRTALVTRDELDRFLFALAVWMRAVASGAGLSLRPAVS